MSRSRSRCRAAILKQGSRLASGVAECRSLDGKLLTHHGITHIRAAGQAVA